MHPPVELRLFDQAPIAFAYFDNNLRLTRYNQRARAFFGALVSEPLGTELLGSTLGELGLSDIDVAALVSNGASIHRLISTEFSLEECYWSVSCVNIEDESGEHIGVLLTAVDVSGQQRELLARQAERHEFEAQSKRWQAVLDNMTEAVSLVEADGTIRYVNRSGRSLLELDEADSYGSIADYAALDLRDSVGNHVPFEQNPTVRALRGEVFTDAEQVLTNRAGSSLILSMSGTSIRDESGQVQLAITVARDITQLRSAEERLRESRDELQAVLDNMPDGVWLNTPAGEVIYRNPASDRLLGISEGQTPDGAQVAERVNIRHLDGSPMPPEEYPLYRAMRGEVFANEDARFLGLDGVDRTISMSGSSLLDRQGSVRLVISVARDITAQTDAEAQIVRLLAEAERERHRLLRVIEQLPDGVIITAAPDNHLVTMNRVAAEIYGLDADSWSQAGPPYFRHYGTSTSAGSQASAALPLNRALGGEVVQGEQLQVRRTDGAIIDVLVSAAPIIEGSGAHMLVSGAVAVFQDISELKELDRLKDEFISITSHELLTPLTTIKGYAQVLSRKVGKLDEASRADLSRPIATIQERTERMVAMVKDLLDVSRIATERLEVNSSILDLSAMSTKLVEEARLTYRRGVELELPDEPLVVTGEERLFEQVLNNLLGNAVKYSPEGGSITVKLAKDGNWARVSVIDQGIGILKEQQGRLFERFYRTKRGKDTAGGLGLGLYITSGIVKAHGGRIWVESEGAGKGANFSFTLPLSE